MVLEEHFFRREWGALISALTRIFGMHNLALAEDVAQDVLCRALETWRFQGPPKEPHAWLLTVARNRALDVLRSERTRRAFAPDLSAFLESEWTLGPTVTELLGPEALKDSALRMMFSCCPPSLGEEAQVALVLQLLCGFSVDEVAAAFLARPEAIEKRIQRAKQRLAATEKLFDLDRDDVVLRLGSVQHALYLLFNEGYHGANRERAVRVELCQEAMRCVALLLAHPSTRVPSTQALGALMSFHAARLPSRTDEAGELITLANQDRTMWNGTFICQGVSLLDAALAAETPRTSYHWEAAIAAAHVLSPSPDATPWRDIVRFYDALLELSPSPVIALNRAVALGHAVSPEAGLRAIADIPEQDRLQRYPFFFAAQGELERRRGAIPEARRCFEEAVKLARNDAERRFLTAKTKES